MRLVAGKHEEFAGIDGVFLLAHHQRQAAFEYEHLHAPTFRVRLGAVAVPRLQTHFPQLDFAPGVKATSRLTCQLKMTEALDGIVVRVPKSQH